MALILIAGSLYADPVACIVLEDDVQSISEAEDVLFSIDQANFEIEVMHTSLDWDDLVAVLNYSDQLESLVDNQPAESVNRVVRYRCHLNLLRGPPNSHSD